MSISDTQDALDAIAIIGLTGRFPGARNVEEFWRNLRDGVESITHFTDAELEHLNPALVKNPNYIKAAGVLAGVEEFAASFFGFTPREAEIMDPQHRLFLEGAWEALEHAGYDPANCQGLIGVYAGMGMSKYLLNNLLPHPDILESVGPLQLKILNDKDFLTPLVSYELNLKGPCITIQTACSTSLVAVTFACQSLLNYQCDLALAGGVSVEVPHKSGYLAVEGVTAPDAHCRAFDAEAQGTVAGNGLGIVVLKRLSEAISDGDTIHAVIRGAAVNNDGAAKVGFTATSVAGQVDVIAMAQAVANVDAGSISYIETHGTATPLGDPIEVEALTRVFRNDTEKKNFCAIGSVKTNIGHLDAAAGVAGLIKTVLALKHEQIPPSLHFKSPNPHIDFANSPFYVNAKLADWKRNISPRRAGVSSFSLGGVNAHVVIEDAPAAEPDEASRPWQLLLLSAKTDAALESATVNLAAHLEQHPAQNLADIAYTLQVGRRSFSHRRMLLTRDGAEAARALEMRDPKLLLSSTHETQERPVAFMFPGLGNHYVNMARGLYRDEPVFSEMVDRCCEILTPHLKLDLREVLYPTSNDDLNASKPEAGEDSAAQVSSGLDLRRMLGGTSNVQESEETVKFNRTELSQPALFVIEYALAQWWMSCGVRPQAMIGYSIGEHVAACLAGVFSLEDALLLVAKRAEMIQKLPGGAMLAVPLSEEEVQPLLGQKLSLAAINGLAVCVLSGPRADIDELENGLRKKGIACRRPQTTHAFHSKMMEQISEAFTRLVQTIKLNAPSIPYISNVTGTWITAEQATDPGYWAKHLCQTVRFADGVHELWKTPGRILLEVGPGNALGAWALQHPDSDKVAERVVLPSLRHHYDREPDAAFILNALGKLWLAGLRIDWHGFYANERRRRLPLPTYPFERQRFWIEPPKPNTNTPAPEANLDKKSDIADWFYLPIWKQTRALAAPERGALRARESGGNWLVWTDECGVGAALSERLREEGRNVVTIRAGQDFVRHDELNFTVNPRDIQSYRSLFEELNALGQLPDTVVHLWGVTAEGCAQHGIESADEYQYLGFYSLLFLAQVLGDQNFTGALDLSVVTNHLQQVTGFDELLPAKATVLGPCLVISREYPHINCRSIDIDLPLPETFQRRRLVENLHAEVTAKTPEVVVAYRGNQRWSQIFEGARVEAAAGDNKRLREEGVYLITGGAGGVGMVLAEYLAREVRARLVLVGRSPLPAREEWEGWLETHDEQERVSRKLRKLLALESFGAEVMYLCADVTDVRQMREALVTVNGRFGQVNGVIHAAGVSPGGIIQLKSPEVAAQVLAPKVTGTLVLENIFKDAGLDYLMLCSSLTAITGTFGMVDHCAANAFLDAFAHRQSSEGGPFTVSVNWCTWLEVGQAAVGGSPGGMKAAPSPQKQKADHPLHDTFHADESGGEVFVTEFSTATHWVLDEHRLMGNGMIPGTAYMEMARAAFSQKVGKGAVQIEKALFLSPLTVADGESKEARTVIRKSGEGYEFSIQSKAVDSARGGEAWQEHVRGKITSVAEHRPVRYEINNILQRCNRDKIVFAPEEAVALGGGGGGGNSVAEQRPKSKHELHMAFGPRWNNLLKRVHVGDNEWLAFLELSSEFEGDLSQFTLHPSLMDAATGVVQLVGNGAYLPLGYEKVKVNGALPRRIFSYVKYKENGAEKGSLTCDVAIMDEEGNELVEIEGYTLRKIDDATIAALTDAENKPSETVPRPDVGGTGSQTKGRDTGQSIVQELNDGILPDEGARIFDLLISYDMKQPQVIISTRDLRAVIEWVKTFNSAHIMKEMGKRKSPGVKHPRPNVQNAYVEPRNELERSLAGIWQEMLGIEQVGCFDNFFELGGDSLLATQLISRLGEAFGVDLPLRTLFDAPVVADLTVVIVQKQAEQTDNEMLARMLAEIQDLPEDELQKLLVAGDVTSNAVETIE